MKKSFIALLALALSVSSSRNENQIFLNRKLASVKTSTSIMPHELKNFIESDFDSSHMQSLKTHALPLKILIPALIFEGRERGWIDSNSIDYKTVFKKFGLHYPESIRFNNTSYSLNSRMIPIGLTEKEMGFGIKANIKVVNLSCTACHSNLGYDSLGNRTKELVIGAPSDTFNPELYVRSIYQGMRKVSKNWDETFSIINNVFPKSKIRETFILKTFIKSQVNSYIKKHEVIGNATPFLNGGPGLTNGVASLKNVLGLDVFEGSAFGFTSIPSLGDRGFRSALLYDGLYSIKGKDNVRSIQNIDEDTFNEVATITTLFTVPTMGQTLKRAAKNIDYVRKNVSPILKKYKTPEFPGEINEDKAKLGFTVYNKNCLQCHGEYHYEGGKKSKLISFPNLVIDQNEMNSDPERWKAVSPTLINFLNKSSAWNKQIQINQNQSYVAPILEGLWASAPYMHNGSVPTLRQFLYPETRSKKFYVGFQKLDLLNLGVASEENEMSEIYKTDLKGRNNSGHEASFEQLSDIEKDELLEYLKTL